LVLFTKAYTGMHGQQNIDV